MVVSVMNKEPTIIEDDTLNRMIGDNLLKKNEDEKREPSGKLSAGKLFYPLQWQVLTTKFKLQSEFDEYTLRKFKRGKDVEDWFVSQIDAVSGQDFVEYREVIGFYDTLVNTAKWDTDVGKIPLEVKSVTGLKFRRIMVNGADPGHILQNALYGLALKSEYHAITYIASDDYRVHTTIHKTSDSKDQIDQIIDEYESAMKLDTIPVFEPRVKWQSNLKYNNFPEYAGLNEEELKIKHDELIK